MRTDAAHENRASWAQMNSANEWRYRAPVLILAWLPAIWQVGAAALSSPKCLRAGRSSVGKHFFRRKSDSDLLQNVGAEVKMQTE